mgnify:CR=1 FL=1
MNNNHSIIHIMNDVCLKTVSGGVNHDLCSHLKSEYPEYKVRFKASENQIDFSNKFIIWP